MANPAFRVHGTGCGLADILHAASDFGSDRLAPYRSRSPGDGGVEMGKVVLLDDVAALSGREPARVAADFGPGESLAPGGPGLVSMTLLAQLLKPSKIPVTYYGLSGDDGAAARLRTQLSRTPLDMGSWRQRPGRTPVTHVFSDPGADRGHGDRGFVHAPGLEAGPDLVDESFFQATFNVYAGTALQPRIHRELPALLAKSHRRGAFTVVAPVFDAHAERAGKPWGLGEGNPWPEIDLFVAGAAEARRFAGRESPDAALEEIVARGAGAVVITEGPGDIRYRSAGGLFGDSRGRVPACRALVERARDRKAHRGDTTGAGDNFLGGLLAAFIFQILADDHWPKGEVHLERELFHMNPLRLAKAIELAAVAGGLACLQYGGVHIEQARGERLGQIRSLLPEPEPSAQPW